MKTSVLYIILLMFLGIVGKDSFSVLDKIRDRSEIDIWANDGIKLVLTKAEEDKIVQEYEVILNGKENYLNIEFSLKEVDTLDDTNGYCLNSLYYTDCNFGENAEQYLNTRYVNSIFSERNFEIIKGEDNKNYLVVHSFYFNSIYEDMSSYDLHILNDNLQEIKPTTNLYDQLGDKMDIDDWQGFLGYTAVSGLCVDTECRDFGDFWYQSKFRELEDAEQIRAKIKDNKIYVLVYISDYDCGPGTVEEREYKINNNSFSYRVINTYRMEGGNGWC